ncbi:hypothetical protein R50345_19090 [Paenibacillus sp. FSL R5-0345]|uniref:hypothetical protein n=1 Tax=Paenibacillus sp. FSL R5-0345 TaxID=1536770 RepID=UPI0004F7F951|nr:hypothetical protein [Paenibacillus sp. FSL R5-0345]AIQ36552.1 hypothetical protein R50345_19090 [Paenibacillus sp. FSL R5-0345]
MSKGRVWNRGKHDGTGLSRKKSVDQEVTASTETENNEASNELSNSRIDTVKPMNRTNWVTRPTRVINKDSKDKQ